jgi:hypothetical protein
MTTYDLQQLNRLVQELSKTVSALARGTELPAKQREDILRINQAIRDEVQPPEDHIIATAFGINLNICIRACSELGVFELLHAAAPNALSAPEISRSVNAQELLIVRFLRGVCALGFADEVGPDLYAANKVSHAMAQPPLAAGFCLSFDNAARPKSNLQSHMEFFRRRGWRCPDNAKDGPYQDANDCVGRTSFDHWMADPPESARFNTYMKGVRGSRPIWYRWMDVGSIVGTGCAEEEGIFMVDVAGGYGHDLNGFIGQLGDKFRGRMILQDLPSVIDSIQPGSISSRIERQSHDIFFPQPAKGAKIYFMHMILHDWPDDDCVKILSHLRDAMTPGFSQILINDAILPDTKCPLM